MIEISVAAFRLPPAVDFNPFDTLILYLVNGTNGVVGFIARVLSALL
jgi:hypothetical protein